MGETTLQRVERVVRDQFYAGPLSGSTARLSGALVAEFKLTEPDWPISGDGPHEINDHRRWLARQLMDSRLSEREALGIVAHHPGISDRLADERSARAAPNSTSGDQTNG